MSISTKTLERPAEADSGRPAEDGGAEGSVRRRAGRPVKPPATTTTADKGLAMSDLFRQADTRERRDESALFEKSEGEGGPDDAAAQKEGRKGRRPPAQMTEFARLDQAISGSGIFRQIGEHEGRSQAQNRGASFFGEALNGIRISVEHGGRRLAITSAHHLGVDDLRFYMSLCALGGLMHYNGRDRGAAERKAKSRAPERLLKGEVLEFLSQEVAVARLNAHGDSWASGRYITYNTTRHTVLLEAGVHPNGSAYRRLVDSLQRLAAVSYVDLGPIRGANGTRISSGEALLAFSVNVETDDLEILLNAKLSRAILDPGYDYIRMDEARSLSEPATLLLVRLCNLVRERRSLPLTSDDLADLIYGPVRVPPQASKEDFGKLANQRKTHRHRARAALREIGRLLRWSVAVGIKDPRFWVTRLGDDDVKTGKKPVLISPIGSPGIYIKQFLD